MTDLKILEFTGQTTVDMPSEKILTAAIDANLKHCLIIGIGKDGFYFSGTTSDFALIFHLLKKADNNIHDLLAIEVEKEQQK